MSPVVVRRPGADDQRMTILDMRRSASFPLVVSVAVLLFAGLSDAQAVTGVAVASAGGDLG